MATKYVFVTGGVTSSLGKGIIAASLAKLLQARGLKVTIQKFDPYINVDPGTLNPYEHGECYVTEDGAETDLDLGHYERFLGIYTSKASNVTTGKVYQTVIDKERAGTYRGKTVQVIPHITDEIKRRMLLLGKGRKFDIVITEIGGTVGDIESLPFIEAVRQVQWRLPEEDCAVIHLTLVPYLAAAKELKTKPTQHSVRQLQQEGVNPDIIVCRTEKPLPLALRRKVALFCNVRPYAVIEAIDQKSIYEVPLNLQRQNLDGIVLNLLKLDNTIEPNLDAWKCFIDRINNPSKQIDVALVGKYVELQDAYKSILEAFIHAGAANHTRVRVHPIQSERIHEENVKELLAGMKGIVVAPGFGSRGADGKILASRYAREQKIPFLGICLGMQMAILDFARNVADIPEADTTEFVPETEHPVIDLMEKEKEMMGMNNTMRLGAYQSKISRGTLAYKVYGKQTVRERHRHRYELNDKYIPALVKAGLKISAKNPRTGFVEIVELPDHPFFIGVQFHPELKSTPEKPAPLFTSFVEAALAYRGTKIAGIKSL
ncbi:MAG: CTP synthase [Bacteroidales bacterium]|nr:CTP synthase [Bacteroidales bacterium]